MTTSEPITKAACDPRSRLRLPETREGKTHRVVIRAESGKVKFFITVNTYKDTGKPAELFLTLDQSGSMIDGFSDSWATAISILLQRGEPMSSLVSKFAYQEFEPSGMTDNKKIPFAKSIVDYAIRWIAIEFPEEEVAK